ncbi:MAG TPA: hypothetical protein PKC13_04425 [Blastocatellia bacterium]|nr:hypothetical protein [Blastocatellia bacterium]
MKSKNQKPPAAGIADGSRNRTKNYEPDSATLRRQTATTNLPECPCPVCARSYRYAWGWLMVLPTARVVDLCAYCTRTLRYGSASERQAIADAIATREVAL